MGERVTGLYKLDVGASSLAYRVGGDALTLRPASLTLDVLGVTTTPVVPDAIDLRADGLHAGITLTGAQPIGFPGICELTLSRCAIAGAHVSASGKLRALGTQWTAAIEASGATWSSSVSITSSLTVVDAQAASVETGTGVSALSFGRDANGFWARVNASLTLLGRKLAATSIAFAPGGNVTLSLDGDGFPFGPFTLKPSNTSSVSFRIGDASAVRVTLANVAVSGPGNWTCGSVPSYTFGPTSALSFSPPDVELAGMSFGSAWRLARSAGSSASSTGNVTSSSSDKVTAHGNQLDRNMSISSSGALSGTLHGKLTRSFTYDPPPLWPGGPDPGPTTTTVAFGEVTITYSSEKKRFQGKFTKDGFEFNFSWP